MATTSYIHRFIDGDRTRPLLLLHGTGGDENDLIDLAQATAPGAALLSPRGNVREGGANRFFRRFAEGVFDVPDLKARTQALADFVVAARADYGLAGPIALGFSNGANIAAAMLMLRPDVLAGAVLLRAMTPFVAPPPALAGKPVLILSGRMDPIVPHADVEGLAQLLREGGAAVSHEWQPGGHGLGQGDVAAITRFLAATRN